MEEKERYKHLNKYLKEKFGERTLKICIDGGFTCPNRDGLLSDKGCIYCSNKGSGELIASAKGNSQLEKISNQVKNYFKSYRSERANKFIAYFQNFTNTYDSAENIKHKNDINSYANNFYTPVETLKAKYDAALIDKRIIGLEVATRPDCINSDIVNLLKSYKDKYYICVELGLQTSNENTGKLINRCYSDKQFTEAVNLLNNAGIDVVTHIMVGLPGENFEDLKNTINFINNHNIQGLKIHSTYIVKNTALADMYYDGEYDPITLDSYLEALTYVITHISPNIVIHRISGDAPNDLLVAPSWNLHKKWVLNGFDKIMREKDLYQGMYYKK